MHFVACDTQIALVPACVSAPSRPDHQLLHGPDFILMVLVVENINFRSPVRIPFSPCGTVLFLTTELEFQSYVAAKFE